MKARKKRTKQHQPTNNSRNIVRIIAGQWRGRKLRFAAAPGLRPTPDRVREMLFNWLQGYMQDAKVLDLFAGSGALGFEALSRGAHHITLVESNRQVAMQLGFNIEQLKTKQAKLIQDDAFHYIEELAKTDQQPQSYDLIFLDPPFNKNYLPRLVNAIQKYKLLSPQGLLYLEHEKANPINFPLPDLQLIKEKTTGEVVSKLFQAVLES